MSCRRLWRWWRAEDELREQEQNGHDHHQAFWAEGDAAQRAAETAVSASGHDGSAPATAVQVLEAGDSGTYGASYPGGSGVIDVTTLEPGSCSLIATG